MATEEFKGKIGLSAKESTPWWLPEKRVPEGSPNILFIVLDDVGYAQVGCYGGLGGIIETPNIDRLAANGLLYRDFHTTALCSPTRACLLTGRNHHSNAMGCVAEFATGYPGYTGRIPKSNGMLSEILLEYGYSTFAIGKWHLTPTNEESMAGPFDRWPLGMGFERFYGFLSGESNQWYPQLVYDNHRVEPPATPEEGYHLTEDLVNRAIEFLRDQRNVAPDKPFFLYFCPGACHAPHHVPREWADKYRGKFDHGWDKVREETLARQKELGVVPANTELSPRPEFIKAWDSLSGDEKRLFTRMMEVYAGYLSHTDHHIGRLLDFLEKSGDLANTLIFVVSDNGASAEGGPVGSINENRWFNYVPESLEDNLRMIDELGGPKTYNHYPMGWTLAGNTPFKRWKRETFQGGVTDPLIVHWPHGIPSRGEIRAQYHHAIDLMPAVLELLGIEPPVEIKGVHQSPIEGISMRYSFDQPDAPTRRETQYYEMLGRRAIWHDGWKAVTDHQNESGNDFTQDRWELYHVAEDFSECHDLADQEPDRVKEMVIRWWFEASKYNVLPLDDRQAARAAEPKPRAGKERDQYVYYPDTTEVPEFAAADIRNRSHAITVEVEIPADGAEGVLVSQGDTFGGYSFYVKNKRLVYIHNYVGVEQYAITADEEVPAGKATLRFEFEKTGTEPMGAGGIGRLYINGKKVGEGSIQRTIPIHYSLEGLNVGRDPGLPADNYRSPFAFTGKIERVVIDVSGKPSRDAAKEAETALVRQ